VGRRVQSAQGERGIDGVGHPQVDGPQGWDQGAHQFAHLVELGVLAPGGGLVVALEGRLQGAGGQADLLGQLRGGLTDPRGPHADGVDDVALLVEDQVGLLVLAQQDLQTDAAVVGVLVDEAFAPAVHQDPHRDLPGRVEGQRALEGVQVDRRAAGPHTHPDAAAVVGVGAHVEDAVGRFRRVGLDHGGVVDEAAGGQHHPPCGRDGPALAVHRGDDADDGALVVHDQVVDLGLGLHPGRGPLQCREQALHDEAARRVGVLRMMAPGHPAGHVGEGPAVLAPAVDQAGVGRRLAVPLLEELGLEGQAVVHQPVVVVHGLVAVRPDLGLVGPGPAGRHQEGEHVRRGVLEAARLLDGRPATQVDDPAGVGRGPPTGHRPFEGQHVGAGLGRLDGRTGPGDAEPDHDDVGGVVPRADVHGADGGDGFGREFSHGAGR